MRRRDFIKIVAGSAVIARPLVAHGQQAEQMRRIAVLMNTAADDREGQASLVVFSQALQQQAGLLTAMYGSISAGAKTMRIWFANTRRN